MTIGPNIRRIRTARGLTLEDVATAAGTDTGNLSRLERDKQSVSQALLQRIADAMGVQPQDFYAGGTEEGPAIKGTVPLISEVQAGAWRDVIDNLQPGEGERIPTTYKAKRHTYALRVRGDSMEPKFPDGCIIIVEPEELADNGKFVVVRQNGDTEATFKQFIQDGSRRYLKPLNPRYPIMEMTEDAVFCGVVKKMEMDV